jgi:hypothetical protein
MAAKAAPAAPKGPPRLEVSDEVELTGSSGEILALRNGPVEQVMVRGGNAEVSMNSVVAKVPAGKKVNVPGPVAAILAALNRIEGIEKTA